ncbi:MAG: hypothetical protein R3212_13615 [Xanthomonadales bacterium]|nr:hypothetical protein [Xanthomonadales bacterium]
MILGLVSFNTWACGDSLYRVGKGVSYRVYTAPLPGNVLVYGQTEGAKQLAEALAASGHTVTLADSEMDLSLEMSQSQFDVVIAAYSDHTAVESAETATASSATYLPVALNKDEAEIAEQNYDEVMVADRDEIKNYLKAIHKTLKSKA